MPNNISNVQIAKLKKKHVKKAPNTNETVEKCGSYVAHLTQKNLIFFGQGWCRNVHAMHLFTWTFCLSKAWSNRVISYLYRNPIFSASDVAIFCGVS